MSNWVGADAYERYVGRWSRPVASEFLRWLAVPPGRRWVDVGCGTGALTEVVLRDAAPGHVLGADPSEPFVAHARANVTDPRAEFAVAPADALPLDDGTVDAVVCGLVLNFVPDPHAAVEEWRRVARDGSVVGAYVWDYGGDGIQLIQRFWEVAIELDPAVASLDEHWTFPLCREGALEKLFAGFAGFADVEPREIMVPTVFAGFDDYWTPFLGGVGPAPAYLATLDAQRQAAIRERLRERLPVQADGSIPLRARAWAVRARAA